MVASATFSRRLFLTGSLRAALARTCAVNEIDSLMKRCINLPSPPLPKGDFAPFQEMYLTSGIIVAEMQHAATHVVGLMDCWDLAIIIP